MALCLFCNGTEKNHKPGSQLDFICGTCVQLLLTVSQKDLKRSYIKAMSAGYTNKAEAIKSFLISEREEDEQRKPRAKIRRRHTDRKRIDRTIGNKENRIGRTPTRSQTTVLQNQQNEPDIFGQGCSEFHSEPKDYPK